MPEAERTLFWEHTSTEDRFGCSGCSWTFPNPRGAAECDHNIVVVNSRFQRHNCDANSTRRSLLPLLLLPKRHLHEALKQAFIRRYGLRSQRQPEIRDYALGVAAITALLYQNESLPHFWAFCNLEGIGILYR